MLFGALDLDPVVNPAVLDTATWDTDKAWEAVQGIHCDWRALQKAVAAKIDFPPSRGCSLYAGSAAIKNNSAFVLAGLEDGQQVFLEIRSGDGSDVLGPPLGRITLGSGESLMAYPTHAEAIDHFCRLVYPEKGPRVLGTTPRLGIGARMSAAAWPGVFQAMNRGDFAANSIQNSVRELNLLGELKEGLPAQTNYYCGFGTIESGHTGGTFEGLWVSGVLAALRHVKPMLYGADADHIQVKRGPDGLARAKQYLTAARYYSFYTLDVADMVDYEALKTTSFGDAEAYLTQKITGKYVVQEVLEYHRSPFQCGGKSYALDAAMIGRCVGKYWNALNAITELIGHIESLKAVPNFDLELSIDEHPPEVAAFDCLTRDEEVLFLLREMQRRNLKMTHLAPNFGIEKGVDYRGADGLVEFEKRVRSQWQIAKDFGVMLDVHSGDDLSSATRQAIKRATGGWHHFKISPMPQLLFAEILQEFSPSLFQRWWDDAWDYALREANRGSSFAARCLEEYQARKNARPLPERSVFHHYCFAFPGKRDARGQFIHRHEFYSLRPAFYHAYQERLCEYLCQVAEDLF